MKPPYVSLHIYWRRPRVRISNTYYVLRGSLIESVIEFKVVYANKKMTKHMGIHSQITVKLEHPNYSICQFSQNRNTSCNPKHFSLTATLLTIRNSSHKSNHFLPPLGFEPQFTAISTRPLATFCHMR